MQIQNYLLSNPDIRVHSFPEPGFCPGSVRCLRRRSHPGLRAVGLCFILLSLAILIGSGCATAPAGVKIEGSDAAYPPGTIIRTASGQAVSFEEMMSDLYTVPVVYVGEQHNQASHHAIQLKVLKKLYTRKSGHSAELSPELMIGMEMFDHTYQPVLDKWHKGQLTKEQFLEQTHWYANWKFDFDLYKDILLYVKNQGIRLIGLNIPLHIPPKIAVGGIDNLLPEDRAHLPETVDTSSKEHREYVRSVFKQHHQAGLENFEYFYQAQCVWEDAMAEAIAQNLTDGTLLVLAGNGHLRHHYGIPQRAYKRHPAPYRTVLPIPGGRSVKASISDYIWVSPGSDRPHPKMP